MGIVPRIPSKHGHAFQKFVALVVDVDDPIAVDFLTHLCQYWASLYLHGSLGRSPVSYLPGVSAT